MKKKEPLTPYQQSLLKGFSNHSTKELGIKWISVLIVASIAYGFYRQYAGTLPDYLGGWLFFGVIVVAIFNMVAIAAGFTIYLAFLVCGWLLEKDKDATAWDEETSKSKQSAKKFIVSVGHVIKPIEKYKLNFRNIMDMVADWGLFVMLITANHPILAIFWIVSILPQYPLVRAMDRKVRELIPMIDDPLDATEDIDVDKLIDRLTDPDTEEKS